jgi:tyrosyl-tRNA synthetase
MMSISDDLMLRYYELLSDISVDDLELLKKGITDGSRHPMEAKGALAREIVARFHGPSAAKASEEGFRKRFSRKEFPEDARRVPGSALAGRTDLASVVSTVSHSFRTKAAARRLIEQGGLEINGERASDPAREITPGGDVRLKIGKKEFVIVAFD